MLIQKLNRRVLSVFLGLAITVMLGMGTGNAETFRVFTGEVGATGFKIKTNARMGVPVRGAIKIMPGTVEFDPASGKMGGQLVLDSLSFDTGNPARDANIRNGGFLVDQFASWKIVPLSIGAYDATSKDPMQTAELKVRIEAMGLSEERTIRVHVATSAAMVMLTTNGPHYMHSEDSALAKLIVSGIERVCQGFHQLPDITMTMQGNPVTGFATADFAIIDVSLTLARPQS